MPEATPDFERIVPNKVIQAIFFVMLGIWIGRFLLNKPEKLIVEHVHVDDAE